MQSKTVAIAALMVAVGLAGCASPQTETQSIAPDLAPIIDHEPVQLIDGSFEWNQEPSRAYHMASQAYVNPCVWDSPDNGSEVYFNNLYLPDAEGEVLPNGTQDFEITLDWTAQDYAGNFLAIAAKAGDDGTWKVSDAIYAGEMQVVSFNKANEEARWEFWACVSTNDNQSLATTDPVPRSFYGMLDVNVVALPPVQ